MIELFFLKQASEIEKCVVETNVCKKVSCIITQSPAHLSRHMSEM